jgi:hypothetical protein
VEYEFTLTNRTSMLMSCDSIEGADRLKEWLSNPDNKKRSVPGDDRTPPWGWQIRLHNDATVNPGNPKLAIPSAVIMAMLREAGKKLTLKGQTTFKGETQSGLFIAEEYCRFLIKGREIPMADIVALEDQPFARQAAAVQEMGFRLFMKRVAVERKKHVRVRPRFDSWSVVGRIVVDDGSAITEEILDSLFKIGGKKCGLLDWRPNSSSPGSYGQFEHGLKRVA